ncbi:MAG TPA: response regulator transcription factor [Fimbriimonadaceae bacterium]|nr:response regulator transcription factor [Fimbriimonadaceae bacterium]
MRILIVEDDPDISSGIATALNRAGYKTHISETGTDGEDEAMLNAYGLILLDLMLPGKNGREVCRTLRRAGVATPILMITARDAVSDRVEGLDAGADDYLVKPFAIDELLARVRALTRREAKHRSAVLEVGDLKIDTLAQSVHVGGQEVHLTQREFSLLEALARNEGRVLTRKAILERVFNTDEALPNTVNFHMSSLRKKVDPESKLIQTVHGLGYVLRRGGS